MKKISTVATKQKRDFQRTQTDHRFGFGRPLQLLPAFWMKRAK